MSLCEMSWWRCINEVVVVLCRWRASPTPLGRPRTSTSLQWRIPAQALHAGQVRSNPFDERSGSRFSCYESQSLAHQWGGDGRRERSPSTRFLGSTRHPRRAALKWRHQSTNVLVRCYFLALGFAVYFVLNVTYSDCCCVVMFSISFGTAILSFFYFFFLKLLPFSAADKGKHDCTCLFCAVLIKVN